MFTGIATLERAGNDRFTGAPSPDRGSQTYGGQLLAQALAAAHATVNDDRRVHSDSLVDVADRASTISQSRNAFTSGRCSTRTRRLADLPVQARHMPPPQSRGCN